MWNRPVMKVSDGKKKCESALVCWLTFWASAPVTATMRRIPLAMASSETMTNGPTWAEFCRWLPGNTEQQISLSRVTSQMLVHHQWDHVCPALVSGLNFHVKPVWHLSNIWEVFLESKSFNHQFLSALFRFCGIPDAMRCSWWLKRKELDLLSRCSNHCSFILLLQGCWSATEHWCGSKVPFTLTLWQCDRGRSQRGVWLTCHRRTRWRWGSRRRCLDPSAAPPPGFRWKLLGPGLGTSRRRRLAGPGWPWPEPEERPGQRLAADWRKTEQGVLGVTLGALYE